MTLAPHGGLCPGRTKGPTLEWPRTNEGAHGVAKRAGERRRSLGSLAGAEPSSTGFVTSLAFRRQRTSTFPGHFNVLGSPVDAARNEVRMINRIFGFYSARPSAVANNPAVRMFHRVPGRETLWNLYCRVTVRWRACPTSPSASAPRWPSGPCVRRRRRCCRSVDAA